MTFFRKTAQCAALLFVGVSLPASAVTSQTFSVANMQNSDQISIEYSMQGCFGGDHGQIDITTDKVSIRGKQDVSLSWRDRQKLDNYISYVMTPGLPGGCTTTKTMTITLTRNGQEIAKRSVIDGSCMGDAKFMTPGQILAKARQQPETSTWTDAPK